MTTEVGTTNATLPDRSYRQLFRTPSFPLLAMATMLGRIGGQVWQIVLILFILQRYQSPALAGVATFLALVPGLIVSPIAGALLDRHGRLRLILFDFGVGALALLVIAVLSYLHLLSVLLLLVIVAISSLTGPLSASGTRALFPLVVPRPLWDRANAVDSGSMALAMVVGPVLAGFAVAWCGGEGAFLVAAVIFIIAGFVVVGVHYPEIRVPTTESLLSSAWQSLVYVVKQPTLRGVVFSLWMTNIPFGILTVTLPVLALQQFHWNAAAVGSLWAITGVTTVFSGVLVGRFNSEGRERWMIAIGLMLGAIACLLIVTQSLWGLLAGMVLFGISFGPIDIGLFALRQRRTDPRWFGRVFAVSMSLNFAGMPVGAALAGVVAEQSIILALLAAAAIAVVGCAVPLLAIPRADNTPLARSPHETIG